VLHRVQRLVLAAEPAGPFRLSEIALRGGRSNGFRPPRLSCLALNGTGIAGGDNLRWNTLSSLSRPIRSDSFAHGTDYENSTTFARARLTSSCRHAGMGCQQGNRAATDPGAATPGSDDEHEAII